MVLQPGSRLHRIRMASLVVLGAFACDLGVEPPPDAPLLAVSAREVNLFVARGSGDPDVVTVHISNNGSGTLSGLPSECPKNTVPSCSYACRNAWPSSDSNTLSCAARLAVPSQRL